MVDLLRGEQVYSRVEMLVEWTDENTVDLKVEMLVEKLVSQKVGYLAAVKVSSSVEQ